MSAGQAAGDARSTAGAPAGPDLKPYVPRVLVDWQARHGDRRFTSVAGTLVSADLSGFTKLSEKLAGLGNRGAEELTDLLNTCFDGMIAAAGAQGGDVLKFGGDALLLLFTGPDHTQRACDACVAMRATIDRPLVGAHAGRVQLRMSQGIHSGQFNLFLVDGGHLELIVTGPGATETVECEATASAGQILLSAAAASNVPAGSLGASGGSGRLLKRRRISLGNYVDLGGAPAAPTDLSGFVPAAQREQIAATAEGEHRSVTIAFVKFSGTDELCRRRPDVLARRLQRLADTVRDATERYAVHWLASDVYPDGGKLILTAGAPSSAGEDEERMLRAVRHILDQRQHLELRAGVNCGRVFAGYLGARSRRTFTVMGDAVNLAARLMQKAQPGQLIASQAVLDRCRTHFAAQPLDPFYVKGKSMAIEASSVPSVSRPNAHRLAEARPAPAFVGRSEEIAALHGALIAVSEGRGAPVEVIGPAGIGKTRLLQEFARCHPGLEVRLAVCGQYAMGTPYFAVRPLLRSLAGIPDAATESEAGELLGRWVTSLAPELLPWLPLVAVPFDAVVTPTEEAGQVNARFRRTRTNRLVVDLLQRALPPGAAVVVDEAQWLDDASADLLGDLAPVAARERWLVCALHTPERRTWADSSTPTVLELGPLPADATLELTAGAAEPHWQLRRRDVELLAERSGGHPLFAIELVEAAAAHGSADALPESVEKVVTSAIDTLPAADRVLLRQAAVLGARVDLSTLAEAAGEPSVLDPSRWSTLERFVEPDGAGTMRFRHALFRQVAYEGLSYRRRREMHARVGEVLEGGRGEGAEPALLSLHFDRAGDHPRAWRYSRAAGDGARAICANVEASDFYQRALDNATALGDVDPSELLPVCEALGDVSELAARYDRAAVAYAVARRLARRPSDQCRLLWKEGLVREHTGHFSEALRWYTRASMVVGEMRPGAEASALRADLAVGKAGARFRQGRWRDAVAFAGRGVADAEAGHNRRALAHAFYLLDASLTSLGSAEADHYRGRALPIFEEIGDLVGQANTLNNLGVAAYFEGRWDEAVALYERSRVARERAGDVIGAAMSANNLAEILSDQGHLDQARAEFQAALRAWRAAGYLFGVAVVTGNLGRLEARSGDPDAAMTLLDDALARLQRLNVVNFALEIRARRVECLLMAGSDRAALDELAGLAAGLDGPGGDPVFKAAVHRLQGLALARCGDTDGARARLDLSAAVAEQARALYELAQTLRTRSELARALGEDPSGDERRAAELYRGLGVVSPAAVPLSVPGAASKRRGR